jgi:hypothetical protein
MHRPIGVNLAAIFLGLFAFVSFLLTIVLMQVIARSALGNQQSTHAIAAAVVAPMAAVTIYARTGVATLSAAADQFFCDTHLA